MKEMKDWVRKFLAGGVSRREFVERAATGALSVFSTLTALDAEAQMGAHGAIPIRPTSIRMKSG